MFIRPFFFNIGFPAARRGKNLIEFQSYILKYFDERCISYIETIKKTFVNIFRKVPSSEPNPLYASENIDFCLMHAYCIII